ncbi:sulfite exporter TauE/SafE family protein [Fulvivirga sedimenti]|uniref:Probable membrane transporter protein n=1 Tax=Fulvivirga sedimenti TaxID=2879465 RepID=A0A9X1KUJ0_9BACT|nr:sulfite exporter TauE/SafE family protein [Fulvivirga sedimenti]MCA6073563.1 sulfite exporter TauE/SafE family protein [Fulvivirga sedimenti]
MTLIEIIGYLGAAIIGLSLGLIGGGGSILTVPVLVYLLSVEPVLATAYSLFIVGLSSLIGGINYARKGLVDFKTGIVFTIPAFIAVYSTRMWIVPALPDNWFNLGNLAVTKDVGILLLFALLMIFASYSMIKDKKKPAENEDENQKPKFNYPMILIEGAVVGVLTGLVGAGGGFLIIPALVLFAKLPMKMAVGTSLLIIAAKSLIGFIGDIQADQPIDWTFLMIFSSISIVGIFAGSYLSTFIDGNKLKKGFGWFVLVMGSFMIVKELFL